MNDPFEGRATIGEKTFRVESGLRNTLSPSRLEMLEAGEKQLFSVVAEFKTKAKGWGVYSLSKNLLNAALWNNYADSHRGFCIEYDLDLLMDQSLRNEITIDVVYVDCEPTLTAGDIVAMEQNSARVAQLLAGTKHMCWSYEEEIRVVSERPGLYGYDFRAVKGIYFGKDSSEELRGYVMSLMRGRGVDYYRMDVPDDGYELAEYWIEDPFRESTQYRARVAPVADGVPEWDAELLKYRAEALAAVEIVRRDPYCELVFQVDLSTDKGSAEDPVIYVHYDHSKGTPVTKYFSVSELAAGTPHFPSPESLILE